MSKYGLTEERYNQMMKTWNDNERVVKEIVNTWGADRCNKGYDIFDVEGTGMLEIEAISDVSAYDDDEAVRRAVADGIKVIPVDELPAYMPEDMRRHGWIDTEENRKRIADYCESLNTKESMKSCLL